MASRSESDKSDALHAHDNSGASGRTPKPTPTCRTRKAGQHMNATARRRAKDLFIEAYRKSGIASVGLQAAGVTRQTLKRWRDTDPKFDEAYSLAVEDANDVIRSRIYHLGVIGTKRVRRRYWRDQLVDVEEWTEHDTGCLLAYAKSRMAEFRDGYRGDGDGDAAPIKMIIGFDIEEV